MKKYWDDYRPVIFLYIAWRMLLGGIQQMSSNFWPLQTGYLGPSPWANFDGLHYLSIASHGYYQYQQAFFPFYPLLIRFVSLVIPNLSLETIALIISHISFFIGLIIFYHIAKHENIFHPLTAVILLLVYPVSFYFAGAYSTSLYFLLSVGSLAAVRSKKFLLAGLLGMLASATAIFGIFLGLYIVGEYSRSLKNKRYYSVILALLLIPVGLALYMIFLWISVHDPLAFFHVQSAFGAHRSADTLIFPLQVIWRYVKIMVSVPTHAYIFVVSMFELSIFIFGFILIIFGIKIKVHWMYLLYTAGVLVIPSLTGTLSSIPRYVLSAFPLFYIFSALDNRNYLLLWILISLIGLIYFESAFLQGYFVA